MVRDRRPARPRHRRSPLCRRCRAQAEIHGTLRRLLALPRYVGFLLPGKSLLSFGQNDGRDARQFQYAVDRIPLGDVRQLPAGGQMLRREPRIHRTRQWRSRTNQEPDGGRRGAHRRHLPHIRGISQPLPPRTGRNLRATKRRLHLHSRRSDGVFRGQGNQHPTRCQSR